MKFIVASKKIHTSYPPTKKSAVYPNVEEFKRFTKRAMVRKMATAQ